MALSTLDEIAARIQVVVPATTPELCRHWVEIAWARLAERRNWSWRLKKIGIHVPAAYTTGTVQVTLDSTTITGVGAAFSSAMVGRQLSIGTNPLYTIIDVDAASSQLTLSSPWAGATDTGLSYTILMAYITPPTDFQEWVSVVDMERQWALNLDVTQDELDMRDPDRNHTGGTPSLLVGVEYMPDYQGLVSSPMFFSTATGGGWPFIYSRGDYTGSEDASFIVHIVTPGATGNWRWRKEGATGWAPTIARALDQWYELDDGVEISFPTQWGDFPAAYGTDSFWSIRASTKQSSGAPLYELYPHQQSEITLGGYYIAQAGSLESRGGRLPRYIRGDVILELALEQAASWPGPDELHPSPYDQINRRQWHHEQSELLLIDMERIDNGVMQRDLSQLDTCTPVPLPWAGTTQDQVY